MKERKNRLSETRHPVPDIENAAQWQCFRVLLYRYICICCCVISQTIHTSNRNTSGKQTSFSVTFQFWVFWGNKGECVLKTVTLLITRTSCSKYSHWASIFHSLEMTCLGWIWTKWCPQTMGDWDQTRLDTVINWRCIGLGCSPSFKTSAHDDNNVVTVHLSSLIKVMVGIRVGIKVRSCRCGIMCQWILDYGTVLL